MWRRIRGLVAVLLDYWLNIYIAQLSPRVAHTLHLLRVLFVVSAVGRDLLQLVFGIAVLSRTLLHVSLVSVRNHFWRALGPSRQLWRAVVSNRLRDRLLSERSRLPLALRASLLLNRLLSLLDLLEAGPDF